MKILVVVDSIDVNDSSGSKVNVSLINNLAKSGFNVTVLHYTRKAIELKQVITISIPEKRWNLNYVFSRSERVFTRLTKISLNKFLEGWFGFSFTHFNDVNSIAAAIKKQTPVFDLILTLSKGASFKPHFAMLKLSDYHYKWMAYVHDPYPFHYYPRPYNWIQPGYAQKEEFFRAVSEKAKYSAFPSQLLKEWMGSYFPNFLKTGLLIPHQLEEYDIESEVLPGFFDSKKFSLLHAGNLMKQRSPVALIQAYVNFLKNYPEAIDDSQLLLLGLANHYNEELEKYNAVVKSLVVVNRSVPFKEVLALQHQVKVNIILESKSEISPFLPGKFPHCVAANKPILLLGPYYSESKRLLGDNYIYWSEADDTEKISEHIGQLYFNWKKECLNSLNRKDLEDYCGESYLKNQITKCLI